MAEDFNLQIDDDWKAQARAEKERLSGSDEPKAAPAAAGEKPSDSDARETPRSTAGPRKADFNLLVSTLASPAFFYLGEYADPQSGRREVNLPAARLHIDLLGVLEDKTEGKLADEEKRLMNSVLYELRSRYIQVATATTRTGVSR